MTVDRYYLGHVNKYDKTLYDVQAVKLAGYLLMHKLACVEMKTISSHDKSRNIFIFKNSKRLQRYVQMYFENEGKMLKDNM